MGLRLKFYNFKREFEKTFFKNQKRFEKKIIKKFEFETILLLLLLLFSLFILFICIYISNV